MNTTGACLSCRDRKVKCIPGPAKRCKRCVKMDLKDCVYEKIKKRGIGKTLRMGEACKRCRARKRRCDAKRPCTTCVEANCAPQCEYQILGARPASYHQFLFWNQPGPSRSGNTPAEERRTIEEPVPESPTNPPVVNAQSELEAVPPVRALVHPLGRNSPLPEPLPRTFDQVRTYSPPQIIPTPFSVLFDLALPRIPREPHLTLSSLGPERFQLSDVTLRELDMKFRLRIVCRLPKLGIRFTPVKQRALLDGDTSGTIINPFFIHAAQSVGMYLCEDVDKWPPMAQLQARYVQKSLELLAEISGEPHWELRAQVALWITAGSLIMRLAHLTPLYIKKSCEAVDTGGLQFIPTYGRPPPYSEDLHEKLSVLSQIIYFENFWFLTSGGAAPTMTARIEGEFRHKLQEVYPVLFKICPLIMRTKAILLVRDMVVTLDLPSTREVQTEVWRRSCDHLMVHLDDYSRTLLFNLQKFQELRDETGAGIIRNSCVNCLAHLAALCEAIRVYQMEPAQRELDTLCESALGRLSVLAQDMYGEEYTRLDLLLGLSLKRALGVFDARLADATPERGTKLERWRETVAKVHSDFVTKLPDAGPSALRSRAHHFDGRTEGSRYPNMILPRVQQQYGLG